MNTSTTPATPLGLGPVLDRLTAGETAWARTPLTERRRLLGEFQEAVAANAPEWVEVAVGIKQLPADSPLVGEEWISGPWALLGYIEALADTLDRLDRGTDLLAGYAVKQAPGDRLSIQVLPHNAFDRLLLNGFRAEVWMPPGISSDQVRSRAGLGQRSPHQTQGIALVLGAGNIFSIAPLDVLYQLFADNRAVVLKLNPVTDPLVDVFRRIFAPFIDLGVVQIVTGGADLGAALADHPGVTAVHMTGSEATHDAIVWGPGEAGAVAKTAGTPRLDKPMTSELGGVAPVIVVPGKWSKADLRFQAQHVATQRLHNGGFNCIAAQVVIVSSEWAQKDAFLTELRSAMAAAPARPAWYPGCEARVRGARELHLTAEAVGGTPERTLLPGLDLADAQESAFDTEYFGPVLGIAELPGSGAEFLDAAVIAANERLHGTLGANILIHPRTMRALGPRLRESIARLRYGTIGVNAWTGVGYLTGRATWGAFPGHPLDDIQSGTGVVHNALLLEGPERSVVYGPFRPSPRSVLHGEMAISPKPPWFVTNRTSATTGRRLTTFAARPRWRALPAIFASALRG
jgi:acyl-CoA reductase-like NAD-dependent aldehyde dehydrogenase